MCGIFGIIAQNRAIPEGVLERGTASLAHRGPDDSGTIVIRSDAPSPLEIGLGNRRLAILDLSPLGHQPMHDPATGNWIVFNGEIYNFRAVRRELEQAGCPFAGNSDTEVLLKAYARWGEGCLTKLRGMFAFAIWDASRCHLFLARDPMGIKPLYYLQSGPHFIFASEVRSILGTELVHRKLDPAGLINCLTYGSAYDPLTLIEGLHALPAGHFLIWRDGAIHLQRYWDLTGNISAQSSECESLDADKDSAEGLQQTLEEAVRLQLVSDVPVGVFLSGGIDSSALVSILSRGGITPNTFSIVFSEAEYSEAQYSRAIADRFHANHHEITVSEADARDAIPEAIAAMDLPTMDGINTYFVSRETRRAGVKVALSGLGGDEVFAGYSSFRTVPRMERFVQAWKHVPGGLRSPLAAAFESVAPATGQNRKLLALARGNGRLLHPYFLSRMLFTPEQRDLLLLQAKAGASASASASQLEAVRQSSLLDPINRVSYLESRCYMLNTLLRDADVMSMSHGLEVRVPLIDHVLARRVLSIPGRQKLNGTPKKLLVEALSDSLPDEIVHRPKRGFTLPFERWMRQELRPQIEPALQSRRISQGPLGDWLDGGQVQRIWDDFLSGAVSWSRPWFLYVLLRWCELNF